MEIDLRGVPQEGIERDDLLLFSESQSRFVISVSAERREDVERELEGVPFGLVGKVLKDDRFQVRGLAGGLVLSATIGELKIAWKKPLFW
jgi:phosphoribosylformylglycinamidine synthase